MRLFVAVEPDEAARLVLVRTIDALRDRLNRARIRLSIRWVPAEHLHLTLVFIGHLPDDAASTWIDVMRPPVSVAPFEVGLAACGAFPPSGAPRVLWAGLDEGARAPLGRLRDILETRLTPLGHVPEARPFGAHITLARLKNVARGDGAHVRSALAAIEPPDARFHVDHATLFRSHVSSAGARYEVLERIPLVVR
jgi:2'-5' RNA ligase